MTKESISFEEECEDIKQERTSYELTRPMGPIKFFDGLSAAFLYAGLGTLFLIPFTDITLLQATCLFVIYYTIAPSEVSKCESIIKGATQDLAHIRANIAIIRKKGE